MPISQPTFPVRTDDLVTHVGTYADTAAAAAVTSAKAGLDLNLLDYTGINRNGGADMATKLNTAGTDAAALAVAQGWDCVNVLVPKGDYRIDSPVGFYDRVRWVLDDAHIFAGANFAAPMSQGMFRVITPGSAPVAAVAQGTGDTTNGDYVIRNVSLPAQWDDSMIVTGTNIPATAHVLLVDLNKRYIVIDKPCTGTGSTTLTKAATWYGRFRNCGIVGGTLDPNGFRVGCLIRFQYSEGFLLDHTTLLHNRAVDGTDMNWALMLTEARDFVLDEPQVIGGEAVYEDGLHVSGVRGRIVSPYVESGDDAIAIGTEAGLAGVSTMLMGTRWINVTNPIVKSNRGYAVKIYTNGTVGPISDITITGMSGRAGIYRNGGIMFVNDATADPGANRIRRIHISGRLEVGSLAYDASSGGTDGTIQTLATPADPSGVATVVSIQRSDDVYLDVAFTVEQPLSPAFPFSSIYFAEGCENLTFGPKSASLEVLHGTPPLYSFNNCPRLIVEPSAIGKLSQITRVIEFKDDFLGRSLDTTKWATHLGTDGDCAVAVQGGGSGSARGSVLLSTGNDAAATMAANGAQIDGGLNWHRENGVQAQGISMEASAHLSGATFLHCAFIGYTNQNTTLQMPFTLSGGTVTANAADAFGFLADSAATNPNWYGVAVIGGVAMTPIDLGVPIDLSNNHRLSIHGQTNGKITFYINGVKRGVSALAQLGSVALCPVAAVFSRGANLRFLDVDMIYCRMQRAF